MQHRPIPALPPTSKRIAAAVAAMSPHRVLVAGPDPRMRIVLASVLRREGYDVAQSADDPELLDHVARALSSPPWHEPIDALVLDARDEGRSTLDLLAKLREQDWATPAIVVIARGDEEAADEATRLGASLVLAMPIDPDDLRGALSSILPPR